MGWVGLICVFVSVIDDRALDVPPRLRDTLMRGLMEGLGFELIVVPGEGGEGAEEGQREK